MNESDVVPSYPIHVQCGTNLPIVLASVENPTKNVKQHVHHLGGHYLTGTIYIAVMTTKRVVRCSERAWQVSTFPPQTPKMMEHFNVWYPHNMMSAGVGPVTQANTFWEMSLLRSAVQTSNICMKDEPATIIEHYKVTLDPPKLPSLKTTGYLFNSIWALSGFGQSAVVNKRFPNVNTLGAIIALICVVNVVQSINVDFKISFLYSIAVHNLV